MSQFSGMRVGQFKVTVKSMEDGATVLKDAKARFAKDFSEMGVDSSALNELGRIGAEIEGMVPEARRRLNLGIALQNRIDPWLRNKDGLVFVTEPPLTLAQAQAKGKELAALLNALNTTDEASAEQLHKIAEELKKYLDDPEVLAAFFTSLQPPNRLTTLPSFMYSCGSKTALQDLEVFSKALGVAISAEKLVTPGMDKVAKMLTTSGDAPGANWDKLALLQFGKFPTDFVKAAAKNLALDEFAKNPNQDFRGGFAPSRAYGGAVSEDNVALALRILGKDDIAARDVLWGMNPGDYRKTFDLLLNYSRMRDDVGEALGLAVEAGAGVHTEEPGKHSPGAARFTFDWIVSVAARGKDINWMLKGSNAKVAASYRHELVTGARIDDARSRESSMGAPENFSPIPGLNPSFFLSPKDTYFFIKSFGDNERAVQEFDNAMGEFRHSLLVNAAKLDAQALQNGKDPHYFQRAAGALGDLAGLEYAALIKVRGDQDKFDQNMRSLMKDILTVGLIDRIPVTGAAKTFGWEATKFLVGKGLDKWVGGDEDNTRVGKFNKETDAWIAAQRYEMASILMEAGYPADPPFPKELTRDGKPLPLDEIIKNKDHLKKFDDWMDQTDSDGDGSSFDQKVEEGNRMITSKEPETLAKQFENEKK